MIKVALWLRFGTPDAFWAPGNYGVFFLLLRLELKQFAFACGEAVLAGVPTLCRPGLTCASTCAEVLDSVQATLLAVGKSTRPVTRQRSVAESPGHVPTHD